MDKDNDIWGVSMRLFSELNGSCSDDRGSPKKSPDHTLLLEIIDLFYFNRSTRTALVHTITLQLSEYVATL
jgi:hypothetical protein